MDWSEEAWELYKEDKAPFIVREWPIVGAVTIDSDECCSGTYTWKTRATMYDRPIYTHGDGMFKIQFDHENNTWALLTTGGAVLGMAEPQDSQSSTAYAHTILESQWPGSSSSSANNEWRGVKLAVSPVKDDPKYPPPSDSDTFDVKWNYGKTIYDMEYIHNPLYVADGEAPDLDELHHGTVPPRKKSSSNHHLHIQADDTEVEKEAFAEIDRISKQLEEFRSESSWPIPSTDTSIPVATVLILSVPCVYLCYVYYKRRQSSSARPSQPVNQSNATITNRHQGSMFNNMSSHNSHNNELSPLARRGPII